MIDLDLLDDEVVIRTRIDDTPVYLKDGRVLITVDEYMRLHTDILNLETRIRQLELDRRNYPIDDYLSLQEENERLKEEKAQLKAVIDSALHWLKGKTNV